MFPAVGARNVASNIVFRCSARTGVSLKRRSDVLLWIVSNTEFKPFNSLADLLTEGKYLRLEDQTGYQH